MELIVGQTFAGRFKIGPKLGGGGFGVVHEAEELNGGARVALKVLHEALVSHPLVRERFEWEAQITNSFRNEHVVMALDAGVDAASGRPWTAYELLTGETLDERLWREPLLSQPLLITLLIHLGEAIGAAHRAGVIHADLKPANLYLEGPVERPTLKVLDFGIARILKAGRTSTQVTTEAGTPEWTAPEQFTRGAQLRLSTDVWPIGMIAFRLLTGEHYLRNAGEDGNVLACINEICRGKLASATARAAELGVVSRLPPEFDQWFQHCVVRAPDERFQNGGAAVNALLTLLRAGPFTHTRTIEERANEERASRVSLSSHADTAFGVETLLARGDYASARRELQSVIERGEMSAEAWALHGRCDAALGRYDDAIDAWSNAIEMEPTKGAYLYSRGAVYDVMGHESRAWADFSLAAALGDDRARQHLTQRHSRDRDR